MTAHNTDGLFHGKVSRWQKMLTRSAFDHFSAVIVHASFSQARILERGWVAPERLHLIPHGVLSYYRSLAPARPHVAAKEQVVLAPIRDRARVLGISHRIQWELRYLNEEEIPQLFDQATLVALPYTDIDQSGVLMTALAFGTPVVASRIGGFGETITDGVHGRLTPPGDVPALACALESVLRDKAKQEAMRAAIGELSRGPLSWSSIAQKTLEVYSRLGKQGNYHSTQLLSAHIQSTQ
jgi:glycosyltransferase involved in cell wall biosynthesis